MRKDFENFEARLIKLREDSQKDFEAAENIFSEQYKSRLEEIFPRDVLGAKKMIAGNFIIDHVDAKQSGKQEQNHDVFKKSVSRVVSTLHISHARKQSLQDNILVANNLSRPLKEFFSAEDDISRDPFFALVEDFSIDGDISKEEFLLLQQAYEKQGDFLMSLESLPRDVRNMFHSHIEMTLSHEYSNKKGEFESEYSQELKALEKKGINIDPVVVFVSRSFYKTSGKYKKYEHPSRRMRRTFKIALLRLLRTKLGNIDAKIILEKFEAGENFEDLFMLVFKLLEVINEDPSGQEVYSILKLDEDLQSDVFTAEENKQKILAGESLVMNIASLFSRGEQKDSVNELEQGMLEAVLDENTDIVGEEIYFNRQEGAGVLSQGADKQISHDEDNTSQDKDYDTMSPEVAYQLLQKEFHDIEEEKRKAFLNGDYDTIDEFNERLIIVQVRLDKLSRILGFEQE